MNGSVQAYQAADVARFGTRRVGVARRHRIRTAYNIPLNTANRPKVLKPWSAVYFWLPRNYIGNASHFGGRAEARALAY